MDRAGMAKNRWAQEMPELKFRPMGIIGRLLEAGQLIMKEHLVPVIAQHGLKPGEFDVLAALRQSGDPYALMPTELYKLTMISSGGMTARLDRLEKAGIIERKPHPSDRRALMVALTENGKALIDAVIPHYVEAQAAALAGLSKTEQKELGRNLRRLIKSLGAKDQIAT